MRPYKEHLLQHLGTFPIYILPATADGDDILTRITYALIEVKLCCTASLLSSLKSRTCMIAEKADSMH